NALQEMIELVIEINENLEQLHDSRPNSEEKIATSVNTDETRSE
ncbi:25315_t:CDS:2, partial [Gigaspora margarita]